MQPDNQTPSAPASAPTAAQSDVPPQPDTSTPPVPPPQTPPTTITNAPENEDASIKQPKYLLTSLGIPLVLSLVWAISGAINNTATRVLSSLAWVAILILTMTVVGKVKQAGTDTLSKKEKLRSIVLMAVEPIVAQAVYYFRLKATQPQNAKKFNKIGWKILAIQVVIFVIVPIFVMMFSIGFGGIQTKAWNTVNAEKFASAVDVINDDVSSLATAIGTKNADQLATACQKLSDDTAALGALPPYPADETRSQVEEAVTTLGKATNDCATAIDDQDDLALFTVLYDIDSGLTTLQAAATKIEEGQQKE